MTEYCVRLRIQRTGEELEKRFDTATQRALFIIAMTPHADVVKEWLEDWPEEQS